MQTITIVLADDHPLFRRGLRGLLEKAGDLRVVGEASTGAEAVEVTASVRPDVLILDMQLPETEGVDVARKLADIAPDVHILALSAYDDEAYVAGMLEVGASGYLTKEKAPELVAEAVRAVARGEGRWFVRAGAGGAADLDALTDREREVVRLAAQGCSNAFIADALCIAENTVKNHLRSLYAKTGAASGRELVAWAWQRGLVRSRDRGGR